MSDFQAIADRVEIEALRGEFTDAAMMRETIQLDGDTATGHAYIQQLARARDGRQGLNYAIYHDRYQRTPDGWKFTERVYEVRYHDTSPLAGSPPTPNRGGAHDGGATVAS